MADFMRAISTYKKPMQKKLKKLGTIAIDIVETTPVVWKNKLYRFEWKRNFNREIRDDSYSCGYYHFVDMETGEELVTLVCGGVDYISPDTMTDMLQALIQVEPEAACLLVMLGFGR